MKMRTLKLRDEEMKMRRQKKVEEEDAEKRRDKDDDEDEQHGDKHCTPPSGRAAEFRARTEEAPYITAEYE